MDISRAVILAAGGGTRLGWRTVECPKPLLPVRGRPLVTYTIASLAQAGIRDLVVVVGYQASLVRTALGDGSSLGVSIRYVLNEEYQSGAALSLAAAASATENKPFLLAMSDHLHEAAIFTGLLSHARHGTEGMNFAAAEYAHTRRSWQYIDEATRLAVDDRHYVTHIGKRIPDWQALDAGAFACSPEIWEAVAASPRGCELHPVFTWLAQRRRLQAVDIGNAHWHDVDTEEDLNDALRSMSVPHHGV